MKKFIATAIGAAALAFGGAATAQDLGGVIANIFGLGAPTYYYGSPAVVAPGTTIYADQFGRRFYYDQYGRQIYLNTAPSSIVGYDTWGRPIYGSTQSYAYVYPSGRSWDIDGDGIANSRDRWPNDPRYR